MALKILHNEAYLWFCHPQFFQDKGLLSEFESVLSAAESERLQRFRFEKDRHSFLVSHAMLRHVLSKYLDLEPSMLQFDTNDHGKPELVNVTGSSLLRFNLTHTEGLSACVVTLNKACGIDAESVHRKNNIAAVAKRMFAAEELAFLASCGNTELHFYDFWTLREAYVKAVGTGLAGSSCDFYFSLQPDEQTANIYFKQTANDAANWKFSLLELDDEHRLSIAIESSVPVRVMSSEFVY